MVVISAAPRPWLDLYGNFLCSSRKAVQPEVPPAPIQLLPDDAFFLVVSKLTPYHYGRLAVVCRLWRRLVQHPRLWEAACHAAFALQHSAQALQQLLIASSRRSWKRLFLGQPHLRFDGLYVSRNSYVRTAVREWEAHRGVHVVVYFRYWRFFPDGTLLYKTSPAVLKQVARSMQGPQAHFLAPDGVTAAPWASQAHLFLGRYGIKGSKVRCVVRYPNNRSTEIRCCMAVRSTSPGANNRLDLEALYSYDLELDRATVLDGNVAAAGNGGSGGDHDVDAPLPANGIAHKRGLSSCVFVPWEQASSSVLNLPASQMDFFMPG